MAQDASPGYTWTLIQNVPKGVTMSHSHICCLVHVVFATAERRPTIRDDMQVRLHGYIGGIARENGIPALAVGGVADHVHLLLSLPRTVSVAKAVQLLKSGSSKWIHDNFPGLRSFAWQEGYGAFSIGVSQRETTVKYIATQAEHHKRISFADEMNKFLAVHGLGG
jgi:putative transposase